MLVTRSGDADAIAAVFAQDGDGPWHAVALDAAGRGSFDSPAGYWGIATFCAGFRSARVTYDTRSEAFVSCGTRIPGTPITVVGQTTPGAEITIASRTEIADDAGNYTQSLFPGRFDVFAVDPINHRMIVERAVPLVADRELPLPVDRVGVAMRIVTPTVRHRSDRAPQLFADLTTSDYQYVLFDEAADRVATIPSQALVPGDRPTVGARADDCIAQQPLTDDSPELVIPPPMTIAVANRNAIEWRADPAVAWDSVSANFSGNRGSQTVFATPSYWAARGELALKPLDVRAVTGWTEQLGGAFEDGEALHLLVAVEQGARDGALVACNATAGLVW